MSDDQDSPKGQENPITAEQVTAFLGENPNFFKINPQLIADLNFPNETGAAVSLIQRQVELLREHHKTTRQRLIELSAIAKTNEALLGRIEKLTVATASSSTVDQALNELRRIIVDEFGLDAVYFILSQGYWDDSDPNIIALTQERLGDLRNSVYNLPTFIGRPGTKLRETALEGRESTTASIAMTRLKYQGLDAYLLIGSSDPEHFRADQGSEFVRFIGEYMQSLLSR